MKISDVVRRWSEAKSARKVATLDDIERAFALCEGVEAGIRERERVDRVPTRQVLAEAIAAAEKIEEAAWSS